MIVSGNFNLLAVIKDGVKLTTVDDAEYRDPIFTVIYKVASVVSKHFMCNLSSIFEKSRTNKNIEPRFITWHILKNRYHIGSLTKIGNYVGGRNHATVIYGIRQADYWVENYPRFIRVYNTINQELDELRVTC